MMLTRIKLHNQLPIIDSSSGTERHQATDSADRTAGDRSSLSAAVFLWAAQLPLLCTHGTRTFVQTQAA